MADVKLPEKLQRHADRKARLRGSGSKYIGRLVNRMSWRSVAALTVSLLFLVPLLFIISGSLRELGPPPRTLDIVPDTVTTSNYAEAFKRTDLALQLRNSLLVAALTVPLAVICASAAGFAMSQLPPRLRKPLLLLTFVLLMIPPVTLMVSRFILFSYVGFTDSFVPLVLPALFGVTPFGILLFYAAFRRIPSQLLDVARLEGMSPLQMWYRVGLPLVRPVTMAVALLAFTLTWGNFLEPLLYLADPQKYTLPLGLRSLASLDTYAAPIVLAGAAIAVLPPLIALYALQRYFLRDQPEFKHDRR